MRICSVRGTAIECSPIVLLAFPVAFIFGAAEMFAVAFLSLSVHELCHAYIAGRLGLDVVCIEIQPFGFVARLKNSSLSTVGAEIAVAAAGPVSSIIMCVTAAAFCGRSTVANELLSCFCVFNGSIAIINLLPALPLDGGRILRAVLSVKLAERTATTAAAWCGVFIGACMTVLGTLGVIYEGLNITMPVMGAFLVSAAIKEMRSRSGSNVRAIIRRSDTIRHHGSVAVKQTAVHMSLPMGEAMKMLSAGCYNIVLLVDDNMGVRGSIDESMLLSGISKYGADAPCIRLFDRYNR